MADSDDALAQWAASFLALNAVTDSLLPATGGDETYSTITGSARELLRSVDAGGVPAFMSSALRQIARDNDIEITELTTPNEVIEKLRARCTTSATQRATNFE